MPRRLPRGASDPTPAPLDADVFLIPDTALIRGLVAPSTTLHQMLRAHGLSTDAVGRLVGAARTVFDPTRMRSSQPFLLDRTHEGGLRQFEYEIDADSFLRVAPVAAGAKELRAEVLSIPKTLEEAVAAGAVDDATPSLFQAMDAAGERAELTMALAEIFGGEIDFNTEVQPGDRFALSFERFVRQNRPPAYGVITAAEFLNDGRLIRTVRFTPPGGRPDYFDEQGRSLRRFFLRSPLKFEPRVTSRFRCGGCIRCRRRRWRPSASCAMPRSSVSKRCPNVCRPLWSRPRHRIDVHPAPYN